MEPFSASSSHLAQIFAQPLDSQHLFGCGRQAALFRLKALNRPKRPYHKSSSSVQFLLHDYTADTRNLTPVDYFQQHSDPPQQAASVPLIQLWTM
jgi:hypothetical protein